MLNKKLTILKNAPEAIGSIAQFETFLKTSNGKLAVFSPSILEGGGDAWRKFLDLFLYYCVTTPLPADAQVDWIDERLVEHFKTDPITKTVRAGREIPLFSFVIPFRDRTHTLPFTLNAIMKQETNHHYEVILVDDGSAEPLSPEIEKIVADAPGGSTTVRLPKASIFRAGFARNSGALQARGKYLVFFDSDIVVPPHYLNQVAKELECSDLVQGRRWQIWHDEWSKADPTVALATRERELDEPNAHWKDFALSSVPWMKTEHPWKYVSSNCLAIRRETFLNLGGFRHWYSDYGFEDTDLGLRAWRSGLQLLRSENCIFHLAPTSRAEWVQILKAGRSQAMRNSARKFLLINHAIDSLEWMTHMVL